ncbi:MAG TPA: hypothetical protein VEK33_22630 [Terriglobales bacterium]|nr:hypothetical protein [Terriglobales bacterium]
MTIHTPLTGKKSAYNKRDLKSRCNISAVAPVVATIKFAFVPGIREPGLIEHCGAKAELGCTEQERDTEAVKKLIGAILTVEVADPPGFTVPGLKSEAVTEKSNTTKLKSTPQPAGEGILHSLSSPVPPYGATP